MPGGSFPMFAFTVPLLLLYSCLWIKENGVEVCEGADPAIILFQNMG
jgi:hypothetical protein